MQENKGWICPKCNRVYSHLIWECKKCNALVDKLQENTENLQTAFNMTNDKIKENLEKEGVNIGKVFFCPICRNQISVESLHSCGDL